MKWNRFTIKTKTEAEAERITILSEKLRENCDILIVIKNDEISLSTPDYDEFLKRTQNRMAYQELKKQQTSKLSRIKQLLSLQMKKRLHLNQ